MDEEFVDCRSMEIGEEGKIKVTDLLDKRHKERQINLETVNELKKKNFDETESLDYFRDVFGDQVREIKLNLDNLLQQQQPATNPANLITQFDRISKSLQKLQNYLSNSTLFLPDRIVKNSQVTLKELVQNLETTRFKILPKKKFGFRNKPTQSEVTALKQQQQQQQHQQEFAVAAVKTPESNKLSTKIIEWTLENRTNEEIILEMDQVNGKDLTISQLKNCLLRIIGHPSSVQLSKLTNCLILCGPVARSVFADNCIETTMVFACQQFRLHSSKLCQIYMQVTCRGIIEDCTAISFAPYTFNYDGMDLDYVKSGLDVERNNWCDVADFNWLSVEQISPNWCILLENQRITDWYAFCQTFRMQFINANILDSSE